MNSKSIHTPEYSDLIEWLTCERKRLGLSQAEVGESIGMSQSDISKMENHERRMDVLEFKRLLQVYRISDNPKLQRYIQDFFGVGNES
ncbi:MAG: helix-turn-helix transcriptional regulator [Gammaproteobacteria bacterium]|nr:helix-turn-helix transcriptional regulator [Gammaproteobacteria bacterium]MBU1733504.1 helix-turn-helix transcriptional regulator [Gammaproteobacteria bacterium]MBU1891921.1 helix-turn-helix transcriptional regulator [Gammaproteobacteria bacterium]